MGLTVDGYIRVSQVRGREGDTFISPDVQREQIENWAKLRGARIAEVHVDLDQSGAKVERPGMVEAIRRIEAKETGGIVVAKLDRFARSLPAALDTIQRIDQAGGVVVSVAEGVDPSTAAGKMLQRMLLVFAEWELDRLRDTWNTARERAVERGVHVASKTPTGYVRLEDGRMEPHPTAAPVVAEVFRQRASGASWRELSKLLDDAGVVGPYKSPLWPPRAVHHMVHNRVYLGEARSGDFTNPSAHEPLIDRATFDAVQAVRGKPTTRARPDGSNGEPSLLAGVLRCAGCRHLMKPDRMKDRTGERVRLYRCRGEHASGRCRDRAAVLGSVIEPLVEREFRTRISRIRAAGEGTQDVSLAVAQTALESAEAELASYRDDERISDALGTDRYVEGLRKRADVVDRAHRELADLRAKVAPATVSIADLDMMWSELSIEERRSILVEAIDCIMLRTGRTLPIGERALFLWRGEGPDDLPRRGHRVPLEAFIWPDEAPAKVRAAAA